MPTQYDGPGDPWRWSLRRDRSRLRRLLTWASRSSSAARKSPPEPAATSAWRRRLDTIASTECSRPSSRKTTLASIMSVSKRGQRSEIACARRRNPSSTSHPCAVIRVGINGAASMAVTRTSPRPDVLPERREKIPRPTPRGTAYPWLRSALLLGRQRCYQPFVAPCQRCASPLSVLARVCPRTAATLGQTSHGIRAALYPAGPLRSPAPSVIYTLQYVMHVLHIKQKLLEGVGDCVPGKRLGHAAGGPAEAVAPCGLDRPADGLRQRFEIAVGDE